jgi:hypothetical protein
MSWLFNSSWTEGGGPGGSERRAQGGLGEGQNLSSTRVDAPLPPLPPTAGLAPTPSSPMAGSQALFGSTGARNTHNRAISADTLPSSPPSVSEGPTMGRARGNSISSTASSSGTGVPGSGRMAFSGRNTADYAANTLLREFASLAEEKLNWALNHTLDHELDITARLRPGADPEFDRVISMLGSVARQRQTHVIDTLMTWRKSRSEPPEIIQSMASSGGAGTTSGMYGIIRERYSLVGIFVLCRALIGVVGSFPRGTLSPDLGKKLEDMVFGQLRSMDPYVVLIPPPHVGPISVTLTFTLPSLCLSTVR